MTTACLQVTVDPSMLEAVVRDHLNTSAKRTMVVTQPVKVTVVGQGGARQTIRVPDFPNEPEKGEHEVVFQSPFYIERDDWRAEAERGYRWVADLFQQVDCISGRLVDFSSSDTSGGSVLVRVWD